MAPIFSTQNWQTSLRRKNLRPPPPGPLGRPPGGRPPGPEDPGPEPSGREVLGARGVLISFAISLLSFQQNKILLGAGCFCGRRGGCSGLDRSRRSCRRLGAELLARGPDSL